MSDEKPVVASPTSEAEPESLRMEYTETFANVRAVQTSLWAACVVWLAIMGFAVTIISSPTVTPLLKFMMFFFAIVANIVAVLNEVLWLSAFGEIRKRLEYLTKKLHLDVDALNRLRAPNSSGLVIGVIVFGLVFVGLIWLYAAMGTKPVQETREGRRRHGRQSQECSCDREQSRGRQHAWRAPDREDDSKEDGED